MEIRTGCKINLGLEITGILPNGYHTLDSVFYPLARPFYVLEVERREAAGIRVFCDTPGIDLEHNTLTKAHAAFAALLPEQAVCPGVDVTLRKGIPHGAGLGAAAAMPQPCSCGSTAAWRRLCRWKSWKKPPSRSVRTSPFSFTGSPGA